MEQEGCDLHAIVHSKIWWQNTFVSGDRDLFGKFIKATTNGKTLTNALAHSSHICTSWVHIVIGNDCIVKQPCFQHLSYLQACSKHYAFIMLLSCYFEVVSWVITPQTNHFLIGLAPSGIFGLARPVQGETDYRTL